MGERCETCRFFKTAVTGGTAQGGTWEVSHCRRRSPQIAFNAEWAGTCWPDVKRDDWCGEYSPLPVVEEEG